MGLIDLKSNLTWPSANHPGNPPAVDYFDNTKSGAAGFTTNMYPRGGSAKTSQFLSVSNPDLLTSQYNNPVLNLQGEQTPNSYIKQPFILRGIQRPGTKAKPQRWGFGMTFDDGFMRGGIVTATERALVDTLRIAKWMITPKGLLWNVKQLGLGFANPKVETVSGTGIPQTRLHIGPTTLLSVAGNAFGQHFTSHGLPFVSVLGNYENVQKAKLLVNFGNPSNNRLIQLKQELFTNPITKYLPIIGSLSGIGGANSVYGIGRTDIRRYVNSTEGHTGKFITLQKIKRATSLNLSDDGVPTARFQYNIGNQYFSLGTKTSYKSAIGLDNTYGKDRTTITNITGLSKYKPTDVPEVIDSLDPKNTYEITTQYLSTATTSKFKSAGKQGGTDIRSSITYASGVSKLSDDTYAVNPISSGSVLNDNVKNLPISLETPEDLTPTIGKYATVAYGLLKRESSITFNDFRKSLTPDAQKEKWINLPNLDYGTHNIEKKYGINNSGEDSADFINFSFTPRSMDGTIGSAIYFTAFLDSVSDSMSPTWNAEFDQGRADARILYGSFARSVSISFRVAIFNKSQRSTVYDKLEQLAKLTMPVYGNETFIGTFCNVTVGSLYRSVPMYIDSISYDWDSESPWVLDSGLQVPMYTSVTMNCNWIGDKRPSQDAAVFSMNSRT
jgi:hypothetical protein